MSKKNGDDLYRRAREGDDEALEHYLGHICAPLFDFCLHLTRQPVAAEVVAVDALREVARLVREDRIHTAGPLATAAAHALVQLRDTLVEAPPPTDPLDAALMELPLDQRVAVLAACSLDTSEDELACVLGLATEEAEHLRASGLVACSLNLHELREALDERAARTFLPRGLPERALA